MKNTIKSIITLFVALSFWQCSLIEEIFPKSTNKEISGEWSVAQGTGGGNVKSPKNRFYQFKVSGNAKTVTIHLTANVEAAFYLMDSKGKELRYSYTGKDQNEEIELNDDTYTVMITSAQRDAIGTYKLNVSGASSSISQIPDNRLRLEKITFSADGGGGNAKTFRNHYYKFQTTEASSTVDVSLDIAANDGFIFLYNHLGEEVGYSYAGRSQYVIRDLPKGTHTIMIGTQNRDALNGVYELNVFGKVQNLARVVSQGETLKDKWAGATQTFSVRVTEDNSRLDVALKSPDHNGSFTVHDPLGNQIAYSWSGRDQFTINDVNKGTYTIKTVPEANTSKNGNYSLIVYGQFAEFKRQ